MSPPDLKLIVESLVFASEKPISAREIGAVLRGAAAASPEDETLAEIAKSKENDIINAVDQLSADYLEVERAFEIRETASGWQLVSSARFAPWLRQLFPESKPARLSAPALETLAIIAYRQPVTRADIEAVRGVAVDGVMTTILDRGLVRIAGRSELPGRPLLYETTTFFMEHFGLRNLDDLPNAAELRQAAIAAATEPEPTKTLEGEAPTDPSDPPSTELVHPPEAEASADPTPNSEGEAPAEPSPSPEPADLQENAIPPEDSSDQPTPPAAPPTESPEPPPEPSEAPPAPPQ